MWTAAPYLNRWVHAEMEAGERGSEGLSGVFFGNPRFSDPRIVAMNSTIANTNIVWHGGRLLALEGARLSTWIRRRWLQNTTISPASLGPVTAHPDRSRDRRMVQFAYAAKGRFTADLSYRSSTATATRAAISSGTLSQQVQISSSPACDLRFSADRLDGAP
jgi:carotenoid cleavage dioxygenase